MANPAAQGALHSLRVRVLGVGGAPGEGSDPAGCDQGPPLIPIAPGRSQQTAQRKRNSSCCFSLFSRCPTYSPHAATDAARANLLPTALPIGPRQPVPKGCRSSNRLGARRDCRSRSALVRSYDSDPCRLAPFCVGMGVSRRLRRFGRDHVFVNSKRIRTRPAHCKGADDG